MRAYGWMSALLLLSACTVSAQPAGRAPDWLGGYWLSCEGGETAESWIGAGKTTLLGTNLHADGFEFLRIAENGRGGLSYFSMPDGRSPPTEFTMTSNDGRRVVFENPQHDFPQRVIYERNFDTLNARIEGTVNGNVELVSWRFQRAEQDTRCPG